MKPTPSGPSPSTPSPEAVEGRSEELTAEEKTAGVDDPAALAEAVLTESEARTFDRARTTREHRTSEDTVEPSVSGTNGPDKSRSAPTRGLSLRRRF